MSATVAGTHEVVSYEAGYDGILGYTLNVQCLSGPCKLPPPAFCTLKDLVSYNSGTITMNFTIGNKTPVAWRGWLNDRNSMKLLWQTSQPVTYPATTMVTKTTSGISGRGTVAILSTLTTANKGIVCSSWVYVHTGPVSGSSTVEGEETDEGQADDDASAMQVH